jgi:uncharacterized membrane protein YgcG
MPLTSFLVCSSRTNSPSATPTRFFVFMITSIAILMTAAMFLKNSHAPPPPPPPPSRIQRSKLLVSLISYHQPAVVFVGRFNWKYFLPGPTVIFCWRCQLPTQCHIRPHHLQRLISRFRRVVQSRAIRITAGRSGRGGSGGRGGRSGHGGCSGCSEQELLAVRSSGFEWCAPYVSRMDHRTHPLAVHPRYYRPSCAS